MSTAAPDQTTYVDLMIEILDSTAKMIQRHTPPKNTSHMSREQAYKEGLAAAIRDVRTVQSMITESHKETIT